jgi:hypothetical protein
VEEEGPRHRHTVEVPRHGGAMPWRRTCAVEEQEPATMEEQGPRRRRAVEVPHRGGAAPWRRRTCATITLWRSRTVEEEDPRRGGGGAHHRGTTPL